MSRDQNVATQQRAAGLLNSGNLDAFVDTLFAPDAVDHDPAPQQGAGREGFRNFFHELATAFPDTHLEPVAMVADEDTVAFAYTLTGTHRGDFQGIEPTGRAIQIRGLQIGRFQNGQIVERWGASDQLGILQQLGAAPEPGGPGLVGRLKGVLGG